MVETIVTLKEVVLFNSVSLVFTARFHFLFHCQVSNSAFGESLRPFRRPAETFGPLSGPGETSGQSRGPAETYGPLRGPGETCGPL